MKDATMMKAHLGEYAEGMAWTTWLRDALHILALVNSIADDADVEECEVERIDLSAQRRALVRNFEMLLDNALGALPWSFDQLAKERLPERLMPHRTCGRRPLSRVLTPRLLQRWGACWDDARLIGAMPSGYRFLSNALTDDDIEEDDRYWLAINAIGHWPELRRLFAKFIGDALRATCKVIPHRGYLLSEAAQLMNMNDDEWDDDDDDIIESIFHDLGYMLLEPLAPTEPAVATFGRFLARHGL